LTTIAIPPLPPARGYEGTGRADVAPRYEDVTQDGRVVLTSLMPGVGFAVWRELLSKMPALETFRAKGILPILRRLVICEGPNAGPFSVHVPFSFEGTWRLARERGGDRIFVNMWVDAFAPVAHTLGPPPAPGAERVLLGRVFAEHVVTRPFGPPEERKVTRLDPASGLPEIPEDEHDFLAHEALVAPNVRLEPADPPTVTFGLMHTDSNQHVNSLVYPRVFEELAVRRHGDAKLLARAIEMRWRKPFFAGDRARVTLAIERSRAFGSQAFGTFAPEASSDRASCVIAATLR
jgi:hypothetical protein